MPWTEMCFEGTEDQKFFLGKRLGSGSFGQVFLAKNCQTGKELAVKVELASRSSLLFAEARLLKRLTALGFPQLQYVGMEGGYNLLAMDLLGPSLDAVFNKCGRRFSFKTLLMLAVQMLDRLEHLHSKEYIHRDIKPENFLIGLGEQHNVIHLIDFGLSKKRRDAQRKESKSLTGTARYASVRAHHGADQGFGDDLESMAYVLLYFFHGRLPWQGLNADTKEGKHAKILDMKRRMSVEELGQGCHPVFANFLRYARTLQFEDTPDYEALRRTFRDALQAEGLQDDGLFDWQLRSEVSDVSLRSVSTQPGPRADQFRPKRRHSAGKRPVQSVESKFTSTRASTKDTIVNQVGGFLRLTEGVTISVCLVAFF
ncbi:unnamed protein product [Effrenium voratum]|nr:unnamed protein product [Effrenium voratum]